MDTEKKLYALIVQAEELQKDGVGMHREVKLVAEEARQGIQDAIRPLLRAGLIQTTYMVCAAFLVVVLTVTGLNWYIRLKGAEVAELKNQAAIWEQKAGKAKLSTCGPKDQKGRLCVKVVKGMNGWGENGDWMIIDGY